MSYFVVKAKFGHVGRNNYILKNLYFCADSGKEAAEKARWTSRVKHHHKDAIREVKKISLEEYSFGIDEMSNDLYFKVRNSSEQRRLMIINSKEVYREPEKIVYKKRRNGQYLKIIAREKELKKECLRWCLE